MNMKKLIRFFTSKIFIVAVLILIQLGFLLGLVISLSEYFVAINFCLTALSIIMSIYIIDKNENPSYKLAWVLLLMALPIFGGLIYALFGGQKVPKALRKRDHESQESRQGIIHQDKELLNYLEECDPIAHKQAKYLWENVDFPLYHKTETTFFPLGEDKFRAMIQELKKAEKFIFLEYFIIEEGLMWNTVLDILCDKVQQGVDVRVMYDDAGCIGKLSNHYDEKMRRLGIKCKVFNPFRPRLAMQMNNRDHRKILVVDGVVGMTGGVNLADEYINAKQRFGHWKDCAVMIKGEAVWSLTLMFLQFWNYDEKIKDDFYQFKADPKCFEEIKDDGYVQPYSDSPTDDENVGENTHINMINGANHYVYATTPYLIIDSETKTALTLAAKNGIDVRILVPHIPDKRYVFELTRGNYRDLLSAGVKIYEYTPGFVHAKTFVVDDKMAVVGTINMDYRSYYLHYECGVWFYRSRVVDELKKDYLETLNISHQVTIEECRQTRLIVRMIRAVLNLFAPML